MAHARSISEEEEDRVIGYDLEDQITTRNRTYSPRFSTSTISPNDVAIRGLEASPSFQQSPALTSKRSRARAATLYEAAAAVDALNPSGLTPQDLELEEHDLNSDSDSENNDEEDELDANQLRSKGSQGRGGWKMVGESDGPSSPVRRSSEVTAARANAKRNKNANRFQPLDLTEKIWMWASVVAVSGLTACGVLIVAKVI